MLSIRNISFAIEGKPLFSDASATIPTGHKVGIVGRNGTGKTSLFRLIRNEWSLESGEIEVPRNFRIGGVAQEAPASDDSLLETVLAADVERASLLSEAETATDPERIAHIHTRLADIDAHSAEARAATILAGLGFDEAAQARPCHEFSGGWRMRVALGAVLFSEPDLLLLDEPTNYLDLEGTVWLESFLAKYPHTVLVISHDRELLNRSVTGILHLMDQKLSYYTGTYDQFDAERRMQLEQQQSMKRKQDAQRAHIQAYVDRFRYKASKARQAQSRLKLLEKMQPIAGVTENRIAEFHFPGPEELPPPLVTIEGGSVGYDGTPVLQKMNLRLDQDDRIALLGANGEGKSTLSKLLAGRMVLMDGKLTKPSKLRVGFFAQHQLDELVEGETPFQHMVRLRPDEGNAQIRSRLGAAGIGADIVENPVERLSGGQKARLLMAMAAIDAPHILRRWFMRSMISQALLSLSATTRIWWRRWLTGSGWSRTVRFLSLKVISKSTRPNCSANAAVAGARRARSKKHPKRWAGQHRNAGERRPLCGLPLRRRKNRSPRWRGASRCWKRNWRTQHFMNRLNP
jgi:ATP-binding cassette subfamily F protein 3